ncbi:Putative uncharacterized protein [Lactobacillus delbrueckii subsp. lactis]|nr:Putative uncharacterized protein [Lactobacillus delbrueckii subsp. lactis]
MTKKPPEAYLLLAAFLTQGTCQTANVTPSRSHQGCVSIDASRVWPKA